MKTTLRVCALLALAPLSAQADGFDIIGGSDNSTQTIHHCGFLQASPGRYTNSPVTIGIIEKKLSAMGYKVVADNAYKKADKKAVKAFQRDQGLQVDGIVGPQTAQRLAYATHPSTNVKRCYRTASRLR
ncbi:MAG: peptidoglycan-binding domain-containing protein [Rickettsiales bacterium]